MLEKFEGEKRKQYVVLGIALAVGMGVILFLSSQTSGDKKEVVEEKPKVKIVDEKKVEEESFKSVYGRKLLEQKNELEELRREIEKLQKENEKLKKKKAVVPITAPPPPPVTAGGSSSQPQTGGKVPPPPVLPSPVATSQRKKEEEPPTAQVITDLIVMDVEDGESKPPLLKEDKEEVKEEPSKRKAGEVIPAGSFVPGILLNGLNAPAGGKALSNPLPVLIRIVDLSILPNDFRADIKGCFVIGAGYGDLSSERAYIRLEGLSCIKTDGEVIERKVEGYVSGEDGLVGLAGRVVTKQGQLLARTLIAGFLEGVANAFQYSSTNLLIAPQGAVSTINPDRTLQYGIVSGTAEAAKKLADFYMKLANQMFPVIEVNAGRKVDIVFLKSVSLVGGDKK